jgi:hypothetical protein
MSTLVPIKYEDLESALLWSSSGAPLEHQAFIARSTGEVHLQSMNGDFEDELPEDLEDGSLYVAMPHKNELDLGRSLVFAFVESHAPQLSGQVHACFHQRGAYSKFKSILERASLLDRWHSYETAAVKNRLQLWASENGFIIARQAGNA